MTNSIRIAECLLTTTWCNFHFSLFFANAYPHSPLKIQRLALDDLSNRALYSELGAAFRSRSHVMPKALTIIPSNPVYVALVVIIIIHSVLLYSFSWVLPLLYVFPARIWHPAVICYTISRDCFFHFLFLRHCLMWWTAASIDLVFRARSCAAMISASMLSFKPGLFQPFVQSGGGSCHAMQDQVFLETVHLAPTS